MGIVQLLSLVVVVHGLPAVSKSAAAPAAMQADCVAISINVNDYWCQTMCPTGQCPADMCKCGVEKPSPSPVASASDANATSFSAKGYRDLTQSVGDVPLVIVGEDGACKSLSDSASDEWCTSTCKGNMANCPTMCECDEDNKETVTVDPIQQNANNPQPDNGSANGIPTAPVAATAPVGAPATAAVPAAGVDDASKCKSLSPAATDEWCVHSCGTGSCPPTMCQCGDAPAESPAAAAPAAAAAPVAAAPAPVAAVPVPATSPAPAAVAEPVAAAPAPVAAPATTAVPVPATSPAPAVVAPVAEPAPVAAAPAPVAEAPAAPQIDTSKCVAISPAATNEWCILTCGTGSCPETLCQCDGAAPSPAAGAPALFK